MYSEGFRQAALLLYKTCKNMKFVSQTLNISTSTIWSWVHFGIVPKQRYKSATPCNVVQFIRDSLTRKPCLTQVELKNIVKETFDLTISKHCLRSILHKLNFSRKRLRFRGASTHSETLKRPALERFKRDLDNIIDPDSLFSVDESGFDFRCHPTYGYAPKGSNAIMTRRTLGRTRTSLIMAMNRIGHVKYVFVDRTTTASHFNTFVNTLPHNCSLIMDICSIHKTKDVKRSMASNNQTPLFIPPYTPECNPIENVFSVIKDQFRKRLTTLEKVDDGKLHKDILHSIIQNLPSVLFSRCFAHMAKWVEGYLNNSSSETSLSIA